MDLSVLQRFFCHTATSKDGCWEWRGSRATQKGRKPYGMMRIAERKQYAHRLAYEHFVGELIDGEVIDHLCDNQLCVNPLHLQQTSHRTNILRGVSVGAKNYLKHRAPCGHPYTHTRATGGRACLPCENEKRRRRYYEKLGREVPEAVRYEKIKCEHNDDEKDALGNMYCVTCFQQKAAAIQRRKDTTSSYGLEDRARGIASCGHPFDYVLWNGSRVCKRCKNAAAREAHKKKKWQENS